MLPVIEGHARCLATSASGVKRRMRSRIIASCLASKRWKYCPSASDAKVRSILTENKATASSESNEFRKQQSRRSKERRSNRYCLDVPKSRGGRWRVKNILRVTTSRNKI